MFDDEALELAATFIKACKEKDIMVATAESCTGGLIGGLLTAVAGSSAVFERGFITYSNEAKHECLGVSVALLETHGAVSDPVACAMAQGAVEKSHASLAVSVTGIAGPSGGTKEKPVGMVVIGSYIEGGQPEAEKFNFDGDRDSVRRQTVVAALKAMLKRVRTC